MCHHAIITYYPVYHNIQGIPKVYIHKDTLRIFGPVHDYQVPGRPKCSVQTIGIIVGAPSQHCDGES